MNQIKLEIICPKCGHKYGKVNIYDISKNKIILCHNCKTTIKLSNPDGGIKKIARLHNFILGLGGNQR